MSQKPNTKGVSQKPEQPRREPEARPAKARARSPNSQGVSQKPNTKGVSQKPNTKGVSQKPDQQETIPNCNPELNRWGSMLPIGIENVHLARIELATFSV